MPAPARIKGRQLSFLIDGDEYNCNFSSLIMNNEETDTGDNTVTFCDAESGGKQWFFETTSVASTEAGSFWRFLWDAYDSGPTTGIAFVYAPHGNATASASQPHFTGTLDLTGRPTMGGEAGPGDFTFDYRLDIVGEPVLDTTP